MDMTITEATHRVPIAKMVLYMMRIASEHYMKTSRFGAEADDLLLGCAVFVGQAERRPMSASKLAEYAGIPRPTAIRKLAQMHDMGILERTESGHYLIPLKLINSAEAMAASRSIRRSLIRTAANVSSLDASPVASGE